MNNNTLPTDDLKKYGIIEEDNSFSKKLTADDIQKFLQGASIVADNDKKRIIFSLTDQNTQLNVQLFEREEKITELLEKSKTSIQYSDVSSQYSIQEEKNTAQLGWTKMAFLYDEKEKRVYELDMLKNAEELTQKIIEKEDPEEIIRYKTELNKLKSKLQDKIDQYPEIAKEITNDLNIVEKEINSVNSISRPEKQQEKEQKTAIKLNVNDPDMFQDANEEGEEQEEEIQQNKRRGR